MWTHEEEEAELHFKSTTTRDKNGRYIVRLPLKQGLIKHLNGSREMAIRRLMSYEKRAPRNMAKHQLYKQFMSEYKQLGHMIESKSILEPQFTLPHHAIEKLDSTTTKLRVVFDGAATPFGGISINRALLTGPSIQKELFDLLLLFRVRQFVLTADIEKMYRQVLVHASDQRFQQIVWRDDPSQDLKTYQLTTITYGLNCAPFLATRVLKQIADDYAELYPNASKAVNDFYMDDLLTGSDDMVELLQTRNEMIIMLQLAGMNLRKFASNNEQLLDGLKHENCEQLQDLSGNSTDQYIKTLGLYWDTRQDTIKFKVKQYENPRIVTRRYMAAFIGRIFDPLGLISPIVIKGKMLLQESWSPAIRWDDQVPMELNAKFNQFVDDLKNVNHISFPRWVREKSIVSTELHGFADASKSAYGAVVYIRSINTQQKCKVSLICSKSKVAPLKTRTIPQLELCAALLLSELITRVKRATNVNYERVVLWSDSMIVLCWLKKSASSLKVFEANRIAKIQELTSDYKWCHVKSHENPADLTSRGTSSIELASSTLWTRGPAFLDNFNLKIPPLQFEDVEDTIICEMNIEKTTNGLTMAVNKYSNLRTLINVFAYVFRFVTNCRADKITRLVDGLSMNEVDQGHRKIIYIVQSDAFSLELYHLLSGHSVPKSSSLRSLAPFLDDDKLIRVGGRIEHSQELYNKKHPYLIPSNHAFTRLVIRSMHESSSHAGPAVVLSLVRELYWPIAGKTTTKMIVRNCVICHRNKPIFRTQIMGSLPEDRVTVSPPFHVVGVDFAGPVGYKDKTRRNSPIFKAYIALFVCFSTKAIHLELVPDLTSLAFLRALKRFIAIRGRPAKIWSDNATNFIGAKRYMNEVYDRFITSNEELSKYLDFPKKIERKTIPPRSPHFGGLWEAGIKSMKRHLTTALQRSIVSYEEMDTIIKQISACLNSRPLTEMSDSPLDLEPLTPSCFLVGRQSLLFPESQIKPGSITLKDRWQSVQQASQYFWNRWSRDYLNTVQQRTKWMNKKPDLQLNQLVLLNETGLVPGSWILGRIITLHPGRDGRIRVVTVKTKAGEFDRAITRISPLPINTNSL